MRRFVACLVTLIVVSIPTQAGEPDQTGDRGVIQTKAGNSLDETQDFKRSTDTLRFELSPTAGTATARLLVKAKVKAGTVSWTLTDPNGQTRLTAKGERGHIEGDTGDVKSIPGKW